MGRAQVLGKRYLLGGLGAIALAVAACAPGGAAPTGGCQGYDPCISPGSDVDCAGGSGNGPRYVEGPVAVNGSDPYGLDSDGDGLGCED